MRSTRCAGSVAACFNFRGRLRPNFLEKVSGNNVEVKGGAFRSKRKWYNIQFKCEFDARSGKVLSFTFLVGDAIPRDEWQEHNLVADDGAVEQ
ncbi:uncharacterized protein DUF930 [Rhizobium laguerreae]|uniref:Uncharacterized protein DUF930 n=1 Tax=Rhizobium laguerreae TaxID=1076926 RepID=A0AAX2QRI5_9HYPH|nr:uncharacterized protein DUF930 [Rhizobium laguerreae]